MESAINLNRKIGIEIEVVVPIIPDFPDGVLLMA